MTSETKVYLLDGGTLVIDGFHAFWNRGPGGELRFPCYSVLIEHADGRYLFDTGYDFDHVMRVLPFEKPIQDSSQTLPGQLAKLGLSTNDINYVINSHYHFDHCGGNKHFSRACTLCHAKELEASGNCQPFEHLGYSDMSFAPALAAQRGLQIPPDPALDMYTPKFETLSGDQEIAKGLWLFETPRPHGGPLQLDGRAHKPAPDAVHGRRLLQQEKSRHDVHLELSSGSDRELGVPEAPEIARARTRCRAFLFARSRELQDLSDRRKLLRLRSTWFI